MQSKQIDYLNIALMFLALILALKIPFELFLFSYAVLGPLHYLTEINWLKERNYFSKNSNVFWVMLILSILISIKPVMDTLGWWEEESIIKKTLEIWSPNIIFISLIAGVSFVFFNKLWISIAMALVAALLGYFVQEQEFFIVSIGTFLPTLVHVYIFTGLFMLYGALKSKSTPGLISVACLIACAFIIFNYSFKKFEVPSEGVNNAYELSNFGAIVRSMIQVFHLDLVQVKNFNLTFVKIQSFVAFAYTYHYLNWFSKTSIIKWHQVERKQLIFIGAVWITSVALYYYDYHVGLIVLFLLSFMHVLLEFPLNVVSVKGIVNVLREKEK